MASEWTVRELGRRVEALADEVGELRELVDGQESWSHRKRLHSLEDDKRAAELVAQALREFRAVRVARSTRVREWGSFLLAAIALTVAILAQLHGHHLNP